jgi:hypothetical protein
MDNSTNNQQNTTADKAKKAAYQKQYYLNNKAKRHTHYLNNKAKIDARRKVHYLNNKDKINVNAKQYRLNNKAKLAAYNKQYRLDNKAKIAALSKRYCFNNKVKQKQNHIQRIKTDLMYKIKCKLRASVWYAFKRIGKNKPARTEQLLGCTWTEAKAHFERLFQEGMRWDNHGEWHIDHIRPIASFKEDELHLINHINNLQPLWAEENLGSKKVSDTIKWSL